MNLLLFKEAFTIVKELLCQSVLKSEVIEKFGEQLNVNPLVNKVHGTLIYYYLCCVEGSLNI